MSNLGNALHAAFLQAVERSRPKLHAAAGWLEDVARPPNGARIVTDNGGVYSGIAVFDRNEPKLWIAVRLDDGPARPSPTASRRAGGDTSPT